MSQTTWIEGETEHKDTAFLHTAGAQVPQDTDGLLYCGLPSKAGNNKSVHIGPVTSAPSAKERLQRQVLEVQREHSTESIQVSKRDCKWYHCPAATMAFKHCSLKCGHQHGSTLWGVFSGPSFLGVLCSACNGLWLLLP